jgi:hypothetical protein
MGESSSRVKKKRFFLFFSFFSLAFYRFGLMGLKSSSLPEELVVYMEKGMKGTLQNAVESELVNLSLGLELTEFPWREKKELVKEIFMVITKQAISRQQQQKNANGDDDNSQKPSSEPMTHEIINLLGKCCEALDGTTLSEIFEM